MATIRRNRETAMPTDRISRTFLVGMMDRVAWMIKLRWLAVAALAATCLLVDKVLPITLSSAARQRMLIVAAVIALYNLLLYRRARRICRSIEADPGRSLDKLRRLTHVQIVADLICLAILLNSAGGLINPLCLFMVFHVAIAGIILSRREAFCAALLASALVMIVGMVGALWPHHRAPVTGYPLEPAALTENWFFILSVCFGLSCTFFLVAYFTSAVTEQLRTALDDLERANEDLQDQAAVRSRFLRTIAHQLRSPLAAIVALANAYRGSAQPESLPKGPGELVNRIERRCRTMMAMIDDLLTLTRIREELDTREETQRIDINETVSEVCAMFEAQAKEKGLEFNLNVPDTPAVINARLRDVTDLVQNLVSNAIKYTSSGEVGVKGRVEPGRYILEITDTGIGIPEEDQPHVFEEFFRAGNAQDTLHESSGLGLNIAQAIVTRLAGTIDFTSNVGEATTFRVELPLEESSTTHQP